MDVVALPLWNAIKELDSRQLKYAVTLTRPFKDNFELMDDCRYVIRQKLDSEGVYQLIVAAKLGKGTPNNDP